MAPQQDPRRQAMYEQAGKQALKALSSPEGAEMVANDAVANGPAQAIVNALQGVEQLIVQAAGGAGVDIPPEVLEATRMSMATLMVALMVESGLAEDPEALMQELAPMLQGGGQEPAAPQAPPQGALPMAQQGAMA